jgi:uncharacterized protein (TIGR02246 family)
MKSITYGTAFLAVLCSPLVVANSKTPLAADAAMAPTTLQCKSTSEAEISALFERWNTALQTGDPIAVVANYAEGSVLLPTVSNKVRLSAAEKADYFTHFLADQPSGAIDSRTVLLGCNKAVDAGLYTFTYAKTGKTVQARYTYTYGWDGKEWLITSHHSSAMPEG